MTTMEIILVTLVAAICGMGSVLDERQTHRPLVACTLIGLVLGDLETGIIVGGTLELVALGWMNVGAAMAPDAALASVIATILVIKGGQDKGSALAIAIPVAAAGQVLTIFVRTLTIFLQHKADDFAAKANFRGIEFCHFSGLALQALRVAIPTFFVALVAGTDTVTEALNAIRRLCDGHQYDACRRINAILLPRLRNRLFHQLQPCRSRYFRYMLSDDLHSIEPTFPSIYCTTSSCKT